ncbi:biotin synthase BioB [Chlorobium sp. N1]|uniref:biotin synthase BioB n=1 Tax=Chlorobium sp. N1 TaxID=2491138 RepID=UPI0010401BF6|nr:biotin synthase BioB [Chlorobium sp. N1]TCD48141.1 biotin synthase BioB [Chlorobium sp. N1]
MDTTTLHPAVAAAYRVLETGEPIGREAALALCSLEGGHALDIASLANKVRNRYGGGGVHACSIMNAKSGVCGENCRFCAQSRHNSSEIEVYPLVDDDAVIFEARASVEQGVSHFGIVTSGCGYPKMSAEFRRILGMIGRLHEELPTLKVCASLGVLGPETAAALAECGIAHYNINIQVAPERYGELIADTHSVRDRMETVRLLRKSGVSVCCGGIIGVGESMEERLDMLFALRELDVSVIPINVLVPIKGTPLEGAAPLPLADVVKTFAVARLIHPQKTIKFAAGRETVMKDFQGLLMLSGADGFLTGGYLTTRGRAVADDTRFAEQLSSFR